MESLSSVKLCQVAFCTVRVRAWTGLHFVPKMLNRDSDFVNLVHGWDFSSYSRISGFRFRSETNRNGGEMHFECDFAPLRIQTNPDPPLLV